jgi:S-DNA-T family DNA segregation ATPase FtsK/SpoIIIE
VPEVNLPAVPATSLAEVVYDGEVVDEAATASAGVVAASPPLGPRAALAVRHAGFVAAGVVVAWRRWRHRRTRHERTLRALEAQGNHEAMLAWQQHRETERKQRAADRQAWAELIPVIIKGILFAAAVAAVAPGVLGVALAFDHHNPLEVIAPYSWAFRLIALAAEVASVTLTVATFAVPAAIVAGLWHLGRTGGSMAPGWLAAGMPQDEERGLVVTADAIVLGLQHTPIGALGKAFKDGWQPSFHTTPVRDGEGYYAVFSVPMGVTAAMIADQVEVVARNLHRAKTEVWPTDAERAKIAPAGYVALWVANPGVLDRAAPEWPLLHEGTADVFKGVPAGVGPRGDQLVIRVVANNLVCGGIMGMGKSNACRVVMLGAALDPLAELWVHVFAYNGDFDAYAPRLARYVKGAEEAQLMEAMDTLHELYAEVGRREARLAELGAKKVTRELAAKHPDLRPRLTLFSECHVLFGSKDYGEEATELAANTMRRARKTALWLGFDTQDARKDAIPPKIVGLVSVNVCFYVKTWRANDGFLGDGAFQAGIRATELRPTRDVGRSVTTGVSDSQFELLKWHLIFADDDTGHDDATEVIARAMKNLAPGTPAGATLALPAAEQRDLLADLAEVTRGDTGRVNVAELPPLLRKLAPGWGAYRQLTGTRLRGLLEVEGVRVYTTGGTLRVDPGDLARAATDPTGATPAGQGHVEPLDD